MSFGRFLGVGITRSDDAATGDLDRAVPDVKALIDVLGDAYESEMLRDPAESTIRRHLRKLPKSASSGPLALIFHRG